MRSRTPPRPSRALPAATTVWRVHCPRGRLAPSRGRLARASRHPPHAARAAKPASKPSLTACGTGWRARSTKRGEGRRSTTRTAAGQPSRPTSHLHVPRQAGAAPHQVQERVSLSLSQVHGLEALELRRAGRADQRAEPYGARRHSVHVARAGPARACERDLRDGLLPQVDTEESEAQPFAADGLPRRSRVRHVQRVRLAREVPASGAHQSTQSTMSTRATNTAGDSRTRLNAAEYSLPGCLLECTRARIPHLGTSTAARHARPTLRAQP